MGIIFHLFRIYVGLSPNRLKIRRVTLHESCAEYRGEGTYNSEMFTIIFAAHIIYEPDTFSIDLQTGAIQRKRKLTQCQVVRLQLVGRTLYARKETNSCRPLFHFFNFFKYV